MLGVVDPALNLEELSVVKVDAVFEFDPPLSLHGGQLSISHLVCHVSDTL